MEAFPKRERKPYFALRHSVKTKKAVVMAATEGEQVLGFIVLIPYKDMVMADYLAVSSKVRSRGSIEDATVIMVAQRISTVLDADRILVVDDGQIVGNGTHRELLDTCPLYREIAEIQLGKEAL